MKKFWKKHLFHTLSISFVIIILGSFYWIYQIEIKKIFSKKMISDIKRTTQTTKGIPRKTSYLGRIRKAKDLINKGYFTLATLELTEAIKEKPDFIEPYLLLGEIYNQSNDIKKLDNLLTNLQENFKNNPYILIIQIRKWINEKKFAESLDLFKNTKDLPQDLKFYHAVLLSLQNNHIESKKILKELEKLSSKTKEFQITEEGITSTNTNSKNILQQEFTKKIKDFAVVYEEFENLHEGKNAHLFAKLSKVLAENNEAILAKEFADAAIKEDIGYIDGWILRGYAQFLAQDFENALNDFRHAYELDPIRPEIHYFLALALYEQKNYSEAALFFEKSLEYDFKFSEEVRWKLVEIFARQKKFDRVLTLYEELLEYDSKPEKFVAAVHTAVDLVKKPEIALKFTKILLSKNENDVFAMNIHAWALIANKNFLEAENILNKAKELESENPRTFLNLGLLYEEKKEFESAIQMYQKSYELGKKYKNFSSLVNLAAEKYNELLIQNEKPITPEAPKMPEHSP